MFRLKITSRDSLALAGAAMAECQRPEPFYCQRNAWTCKLWFDERNAIADRIMSMFEAR
ncbi:hypothetical protein [Mesorhizobium sp. B2-1-2]|uniref:hypothetical protein n=1 Tax=Mesorhizobium sp. B2-1-2 TaxID=2589973 RepID=UPI001747457E|nr:hypothetical protein [Mesorhizobium sp. B2-1-2]